MREKKIGLYSIYHASYEGKKDRVRVQTDLKAKIKKK
jgi:hypothetical protein